MTKNLPLSDLHHWDRYHRLVENFNPLNFEKDLQILFMLELFINAIIVIDLREMKIWLMMTPVNNG
jgi:hypothetical protein